MAQQDQRRLWPVVVELADKSGQYVFDRQLPVMAREIAPVAPILPTAEEKYLHAGLSAGLVRRDHVGIDDAGNVDVLVSLHQRQRADTVAGHRRGFEIKRFGGALHLA